MRPDADDPVQQATAKYTLRIITRLFDMVKPVADRRNVKIALHTEAGVAVIGVTVALLLPAVQACALRPRRIQTQMTDEADWVGIAQPTRVPSAGFRPVRDICDLNGKPLLSWRVKILPYLEEMTLYKAIPSR